MSHESPEMLARRELLRRAAWMLGGAISAPAALAILQGCTAKESDSSVAVELKILKPDQFEVVGEIAEIMIPKTQTSGAKDVGVPAFIDVALAAVYDQESQDRFISGLTLFAGGFMALDAAARTTKVRSALEAALAGDRDPKPFILMVRELSLLGFFTSKNGINENMTYQAVPGAFHGCVPISQMRTPAYWE